MGHEVVASKQKFDQETSGIPEYWVDCFSGCETECGPEPDRWEAGGRQSLCLSVSVDEQ